MCIRDRPVIWDREVGGSNPLAPTNSINNLRLPSLAAVSHLWPIHASFLQQYWECSNNAWQEDIGDNHRGGVAAWRYPRAETSKEQAGWPKCVGSCAIN